MKLERSISELKGVGEKTEKHLNKLGIYTVEQLVEHFPRNYDVYSAVLFLKKIMCERWSSRKCFYMMNIRKNLILCNRCTH